MIAPNDIVTVSELQVSAGLAGECIILDLESEQYFALDEVGARVWQLVGKAISVGDICECVTREYEVEASQCLHDVTTLLEKLLEHGLVRIRPPEAE